jgi:P27 family predicted phage terminase small subunit
MPLMGKREWRRLAKELHELGILSRIDRGVMALYCEAYAQVQEAIRHIEEEGAVIETKWGLKVNPWQAVLKAARESMRRCAIEMGMTPSSRARVKANKPESESLLEKFLSRGKKA